jgi:hypothetical protein
MSATRSRATMGNLDRNNLTKLIAFARIVFKLMTTGVASFPSPIPTLVSLTNAIAALQLTIDEHLTAEAKEAKRVLLVSCLEGLMIYVQQIADLLSAQAGAALITSAGYVVHADPVHSKQHVTVSQAYPGAPIEIAAFLSAIAPLMMTHKHQVNWRFPIPGTPVAGAPAGTPPTYFTWSTPVGKTTVPTIPPAPPAPVIPVDTVLPFECAISDKETMTAWFSSQPYKVK